MQVLHAIRLGQSEREAEAFGSGGLTVNQSPGSLTPVP
jgi:hypothetical protein